MAIASSDLTGCDSKSRCFTCAAVTETEVLTTGRCVFFWEMSKSLLYFESDKEGWL